MTTYHNDELDAILDRLRRLETRLCKLMLHMGIDPTGEPIRTIQPLDHEPNPISVQNHNVLKKMLDSLKLN
jgi:hypothetical protein